MSAVYYIAAPALDLVKIGFATNPVLRLSKIGSDCPVPVVLLAVEPGDLKTEAERHAQFAESRRRAEWFQLSGPVAEHVATLPAYAKAERGRRCIDIAEAAGISKAHASGILSGKTSPSVALAVHIFRVTGVKVPRIAHCSDSDIDVLERFSRKVA